MDKFSVIVPNYNHASFLTKRLESILQQTYSNFEVIILDDCSSDDSIKIIEAYKEHPKISQILYNNHNSGTPFLQWIKGINISSGDYIWIAESDDWAEVNFLEEMSKAISAYPQAGLLYSDSYVVEGENISSWQNAEKGEINYSNRDEFVRLRLLNGLRINNASAVVFKKVIADPYIRDLAKFRKHGDYFFWFQISRENGGVFVNKKLNYCRILDTSVTRQNWNKSIISFKEHIVIFSVIKSSLPLLSFKQKAFFYDCWALAFQNMLSNFSFSTRLSELYVLIKASKFNLYFNMRLLYFYFRRGMQFNRTK